MSFSWPALLVIIGILLAIALVLLVPLPGSQTQARRSIPRRPLAPVERDNERYWYGLIYVNPDDPELFVPKRYGLGWTVNFGHPQGKWVLLGLLFVIVLCGVILPLLVSGLAPHGCHPTSCHPF